MGLTPVFWMVISRAEKVFGVMAFTYKIVSGSTEIWIVGDREPEHVGTFPYDISAEPFLYHRFYPRLIGRTKDDWAVYCPKRDQSKSSAYLQSIDAITKSGFAEIWNNDGINEPLGFLRSFPRDSGYFQTYFGSSSSGVDTLWKNNTSTFVRANPTGGSVILYMPTGEFLTGVSASDVKTELTAKYVYAGTTDFWASGSPIVLNTPQGVPLNSQSSSLYGTWIGSDYYAANTFPIDPANYPETTAVNVFTINVVDGSHVQGDDITIQLVPFDNDDYGLTILPLLAYRFYPG